MTCAPRPTRTRRSRPSFAWAGAAPSSNTVRKGRNSFISVVTAVWKVGCRPYLCRSDWQVSSPLHRFIDDQVGSLLGRHRRRVDSDLGIFRRFVGTVDSRKILELAGASLGVKALGVAL